MVLTPCLSSLPFPSRPSRPSTSPPCSSPAPVRTCRPPARRSWSRRCPASRRSVSVASAQLRTEQEEEPRSGRGRPRHHRGEAAERRRTDGRRTILRQARGPLQGAVVTAHAISRAHTRTHQTNTLTHVKFKEAHLTVSRSRPATRYFYMCEKKMYIFKQDVVLFLEAANVDSLKLVSLCDGASQSAPAAS